MPDTAGAPRPGRSTSSVVYVLVLFLAAFVAPCLSAQSVAGIPLHRNVRRPSQGAGRRALVAPTDGAAMYHNGATLLCSDCHTVHFSESHGFDGGTPVSTTAVQGGNWLPATGPNSHLLKASSSTLLCLSCHDGQTFAPDVVETDTYGVAQRPAGFFGNTDVPNFKGHNLASRDLGGPNDLCNRCHFGGAMATAQVQCIDCHNPHGNASYRNLWWASSPGSEPPLLASIRAGSTGTARYEAANVAYPAPPAGDTWREITNMCIDCHHKFFAPWYTDNGGAPGGFSPYHRHPGTNTESGGSYPINRSGAHTDAANWVSGGPGFTVARLPFTAPGAKDFANASTVAATNEVFCLSCHKAHGSENPFSLRWDYGAKTATGTAGCQQCHNNVFTE